MPKKKGDIFDQAAESGDLFDQASGVAPLPDRNVPGAPGGLPGISAPAATQVMDEEQAAERLKGVGYNRLTSPLTPTQQLSRLNEYNPGGQLLSAATAGPGTFSLGRLAIAKPALAARTLLGGAAGGSLGGWAGKEIGGVFGPTGQRVGEGVGGALGGIAGGYMGATGRNVPTKGGLLHDLVFGGPKPVPAAGSIEESLLARRNRPLTIVSKNPLGTPGAPMSGPQAPPQLLGPPAQASAGVSESVAGTRPRSLVLTPAEAQSEAQMQSIAKNRASERGMQFAAGMTPREGRSVPRYPTRTATEEFSGVRERVSFPSRPPESAPPLLPSGQPQASGPSLRPDQNVPSVFQSHSTPELRLDPNPADLKAAPKLLGQNKPLLRQEVQDLATPSRAMQTPEWVAGEKSYELQKMRDILRNPMATEEERAIARARLAGQ